MEMVIVRDNEVGVLGNAVLYENSSVYLFSWHIYNKRLNEFVDAARVM